MRGDVEKRRVGGIRCRNISREKGNQQWRLDKSGMCERHGMGVGPRGFKGKFCLRFPALEDIDLEMALPVARQVSH